mgnify:CR=1 FL=1
MQQISDQLSAGFTGEALASCQKLDITYPNRSEIQLLSGIAYFMKQDWKNAAQCFETVLVYDPDNTQARNYLADLAIEQNNLDVAEDHLRRAAKSNPADLDTLQRLAYVLQCLENMAEATDIYSNILARTLVQRKSISIMDMLYLKAIKLKKPSMRIERPSV